MRHLWLVLPLACGCLFVTEDEKDRAYDRDRDGFIAAELGGDDCDDSDGGVHPDANEQCGNGIDDDCDGATDDNGVGSVTFFADGDGDGFGDAEVTAVGCSAPPGFVVDDEDCDDAVGTIHPGAVEHCDGIDEDCNGIADDHASGASIWYFDGDRDDYGDPDDIKWACDAPQKYVDNAEDCDDSAAAVSPAQTEICNDIDDDCDQLIDDDDDSLDTTTASTWYADGDSDGFGDGASSLLACEQPTGMVTDDTDCDDGNGSIKPGIAEVCNNFVDDNCDGSPAPCELRGTRNLASADVKISGTDTWRRTGISVDTGDIDGDGKDDLLIGGGLFSWWLGQPTHMPGATQVFLGTNLLSPSLFVDDARTHFRYPNSSPPWRTTGHAVAVCDVDGDGFDDVVFSDAAFGEDPGTGFILLDSAVRGAYGPTPGGSVSPATLPLDVYSTAEPRRIGDASWGYGILCGDLDGDAQADLVVTIGAPVNEILVFRSPGFGPTTLSNADATIGGFALPVLAQVADVDGDAIDDIVISDPAADQLLIFDGGLSGILGPSDALVFSNDTGVSIQSFTAMISDVDLDGSADVTMACTVDSVDAFCFFDGDYSLSLQGEVRGSEHNGLLRFSSTRTAEYIHDVGDINGDGISDYVASSWLADTHAAETGAYYLFYGTGELPNHSLDESDFVVEGESIYDGSGDLITIPRPTVAGPADVNGDGVDDLVLAQPFHDGSGHETGAVYVIYGLGF